MIFLGTENTQETWSASQKKREATTSRRGAPHWLVAPSETPWPTSLSYKFTYIPKPSEASAKTLFHRRNLLFP